MPTIRFVLDLGAGLAVPTSPEPEMSRLVPTNARAASGGEPLREERTRMTVLQGDGLLTRERGARDTPACGLRERLGP